METIENSPFVPLISVYKLSKRMTEWRHTQTHTLSVPHMHKHQVSQDTTFVSSNTDDALSIMICLSKCSTYSTNMYLATDSQIINRVFVGLSLKWQCAHYAWI